MNLAAKIALLGTWETKARELSILETILTRTGLTCVQVDLSTYSAFTTPKHQSLSRVQSRIIPKLLNLERECQAFVAVGGGTCAEMSLGLFQCLAPLTPKFLLAPVTFDPRVAISGMLVSCLFTPIDIKGSGTLLEHTFHVLAQQLKRTPSTPPQHAQELFVPRKDLKQSSRSTVQQIGNPNSLPPVVSPKNKQNITIALSALGVTEAAVSNIMAALGEMGNRASVFHANGFGGVALGRFATMGAFDFLIDATTHELTRHYVAGVHAPLGLRFEAMQFCPSISLPGGLNFLSLGPIDTLEAAWRVRQTFQHSSHFTHVTLSESEMAKVAQAWADILNASKHPAHIILPMGGFSSQDCPGGYLENPTLREVCRTILKAAQTNYYLHELDTHIGDPGTARCVADLFTRWQTGYANF